MAGQQDDLDKRVALQALALFLDPSGGAGAPRDLADLSDGMIWSHYEVARMSVIFNRDRYIPRVQSCQRQWPAGPPVPLDLGQYRSRKRVHLPCQTRARVIF